MARSVLCVYLDVFRSDLQTTHSISSRYFVSVLHINCDIIIIGCGLDIRHVTRGKGLMYINRLAV